MKDGKHNWLIKKNQIDMIVKIRCTDCGKHHEFDDAITLVITEDEFWKMIRERLQKEGPCTNDLETK